MHLVPIQYYSITFLQIDNLTDRKLLVFILLSVLPMMLILTVNMAVDVHKWTTIIIRKHQVSSG